MIRDLKSDELDNYPNIKYFAGGNAMVDVYQYKSREQHREEQTLSELKELKYIEKNLEWIKDDNVLVFVEIDSKLMIELNRVAED